MASRDRFVHEVSCTACGNKGSVQISEDDYPFMRNPHRAIDRVEGPFTADVDGDNVVHVTCKCGHVVS